ncbi:hypothetical protein OAJ44_04685 [Chloroflexi bacterium]|nr:hypothetical protein [Chloroflexota bacterium]
MKSTDKSSEEQLLWDQVYLQFGHLISEDHFENIKESIKGIVSNAKEIRSAKLDHSFPPLNTYQPYRNEFDE